MSTARPGARVRDAVDYAERRTADNDRFTLNVALAYGGRTELLDAAAAIDRTRRRCGRPRPDRCRRRNRRGAVLIDRSATST